MAEKNKDVMAVMEKKRLERMAIIEEIEVGNRDVAALDAQIKQMERDKEMKIRALEKIREKSAQMGIAIDGMKELL